MTNNKRKRSDLEGVPRKKSRQDAFLEEGQGLSSGALHVAKHGMTNQGLFTDGTMSSASSSIEELISIARQASRQVEETVASASHVTLSS